MRALLLGLLFLFAPALTVAAVDPADKEAAIQYEQAVQAGNKAFRESNAKMQRVLLGLTAKDVKEIPNPAEATAALADYEKAITGFQTKLKDVPPPSGEAGSAYAKAVDAYLAHLAGLAKEDYRKVIASLEKPVGTPEEKMSRVAPLLAKAGQTQQSVLKVSTARKAYLKAYEIAPADLSAAAAPGNATDAPAPAGGPAALDQAIKDGEKAFKDSMEAMQGKLLAKLVLGGPIDPKDVASSVADIDAAIAKFEEQLAAVQVPDDAESQAYAAAAKKLLARLKSADFTGLAKVLTDKTLSPEAKQAQLLEKAGSLQTALTKETAAFEKARAEFAKKHGL